MDELSAETKKKKRYFSSERGSCRECIIKIFIQLEFFLTSNNNEIERCQLKSCITYTNSVQKREYCSMRGK